MCLTMPIDFTSTPTNSRSVMSTKQEAGKAEHKTKKFGKSERTVPHHTQKARKFYPAEDESKPKKVCGTMELKPIHPR